MIEPEQSTQKEYFAPTPALGYGNFQATTVPTVTDDEKHGYSINSVWYKITVPFQFWVCVDNTTGAAVWREIPLAGFRSTRSIFDRYVDATTTGTSRQTLYSDSIPTYVLYPEAGDKVFFRYAGRFAANANAGKYVTLVIAGQDINSSEQSSNDGSWEMDGFIIRVSSSVLRFEAEFTTTGQTPDLLAGEITGLDLNSDPVPFLLDARSAVSAGDVTAKMGTAWFMPAAPVSTYNVLYLGDNVTFGGDQVIYS